jgi:hypothetical protein
LDVIGHDLHPGPVLTILLPAILPEFPLDPHGLPLEEVLIQGLPLASPEDHIEEIRLIFPDLAVFLPPVDGNRELAYPLTVGGILEFRIPGESPHQNDTVDVSHLLFLYPDKKIFEEMGIELKDPVQGYQFFLLGLEGKEDIPPPLLLFDLVGQIPIPDFIGFQDLHPIGSQVVHQLFPTRLVLVFFQREDDRQFILTHYVLLTDYYFSPVPGGNHGLWEDSSHRQRGNRSLPKIKILIKPLPTSGIYRERISLDRARRRA